MVTRSFQYYNDIQKSLGMQVQLGTARVYPDLVTILNNIYRDKIAKLPFVPADWLPKVLALQGSDDGLLVYPIKATRILGLGINPDLPAWVQANAATWDTLADECKNALTSYMDGKIAEGQATLNRLYANAAFWNAAYISAKFVADIPTNVVKGAGTAVGSIFKANWLPIIVIGAGAALWLGRGKIIQRFTKS